MSRDIPSHRPEAIPRQNHTTDVTALPRSYVNSMNTLQQTPLDIVAHISRIVTLCVDRITGDRSDYPLLVCGAVQQALKQHGIQSRILYGQVAWIEIIKNHTPIWAGCFQDHFSFWVESEFGEIIDLNMSVAHRKTAHSGPTQEKSLYSPPMLWSKKIPLFYRFGPTGIAEFSGDDLSLVRDQSWLDLITEEIQKKCQPILLKTGEETFPAEPILCPNLQVLDDEHKTFWSFDQALSAHGIPPAPF